jgi:hypothetical protein
MWKSDYSNLWKNFVYRDDGGHGANVLEACENFCIKYKFLYGISQKTHIFPLGRLTI